MILYFVKSLGYFGPNGKNKKVTIKTWCNGGRLEIFCQDYTACSNRLVKNTIKVLKREITEIEEGIIEENSEEVEQLRGKKYSFGISVQ